MELFTKICISAFVHIIWFLIIFVAIDKTTSPPCEEIYYEMLRGEFMLIVYPFIVNLIIFLVYKVRPLETKKEKRIFICTTTIFSLILWLPWVLPGF